jgi:quinolinate synthase
MLILSKRESPMAADGFQLAFTPQVEAETTRVWEKVRGHVTPMEW